MDDSIAALFAARASGDGAFEALEALFSLTEGPVDWAYDAWPGLVQDLGSADNHRRSVAGAMLCRLAISDPEHRILKLMPLLERTIRDERFVTARHVLQGLWRAGVPGTSHADTVIDALERRFADSAPEKSGSLVRTDILECLGKLARFGQAARIDGTARSLIDTEPDTGAQAKLRAAWRKGLRSTDACRPG